MCLFDFILNTYKAKEHVPEDRDCVVLYLHGTSKQLKVCIVRSPTQEVVPNLIGGWPPALDDCSDNGLYEASMLLLFNPWQDLRKLKNGHNTFGSMFTEFEMVM